MNFYNCSEYLDDIQSVANLNIPWDKLENKSIMISGATGLIGSFLIDVLLERNTNNRTNCFIYAIARNEDKGRIRFQKYFNDPNFIFLTCDVKNPLIFNEIKNVDYILHLASNTHPVLYSTDPVGTILTNVFGLNNMLNFAIKHNASRFLFASSNEIYGENRGDVEIFNESYCGYIDCNTLRAGYPESKRCGEALCQAYIVQNGLDIVIARLTRSYGPTMIMSDTKAINQFIKKALLNDDIVLKSSGNQYYSYTYVADAASGLLWTLLAGQTGQAYNIADTNSDISLLNLARTIADIVHKKVIFESPDSLESKGYSKATKARLDGQKLRAIGWKPRYDIKSGLIRTLDILKKTYTP